MKYFFLVVASISILVIFNSCKDPNNPVGASDPKVKYVWTVDTLLNPHGYGVVPKAIWGSSPSDVWVVGFNLANQGEIFHYDGVKWSRITPDLGFNYELSGAIGFGPNSVYISGFKIIIDSVMTLKSIIIHYTSPTSWQLENIEDGGSLEYIHGTSENNIWACGYYGTLYHKVNSWVKVPYDKKLKLGPICTMPDGKLFMVSEYSDYPKTGDTILEYFSKFDYNSWKNLDSSRLIIVDGYPQGYKFGDLALWGASENEMYSSGMGLYEYNGTKWAGLGGLGPYGSFIRDIKGTSQSNIYAVADHGNIIHFDGSNWNAIRGFDTYIVNFYSVMPFDNDVFIGAYESGMGFVVRGKIIRE
jgi:hypothetical protein